MKTKESLFSMAADIVVNQISPGSGDRFGDLMAVHRENDADDLHLMRLVIKTKGWFKKTNYRLSEYTLSDILQSPLDPDVSRRVLGPYKGTFGYDHNGKLVARAPGQMVNANVGVHGSAAAELTLPPIQFEKQTVNVKKLLGPKYRCNMQNKLVQEMQEAKKQFLAPKKVLALLTERVVTMGDWEICETRKRAGGGQVGVGVGGGPDIIDAKIDIQMDGNHSWTIKSGTVIAYGLRKLDIKEGFLEFPERTLQMDGAAHSSDIESDSLDLDSAELEKYLSPLGKLPRGEFQRFCEVMKDRDALSNVQDTLEEWCTGIAPVVTEQNVSVSHSNSASAILGLLRPYQDSHDKSDKLGCTGTPVGPLTAAHLLVSAMEELPDEALTLLRKSSPDVLLAFNNLLNVLDLKDQKKSFSPLPLESVPLLQDDKAFHWMQQLLITCNVTLKREDGQLLAERESNAGVLPLVLCVTVQGLSYLL